MQIDSRALTPVFKRGGFSFNEMHFTKVYEGKSKMAAVLSCKG